MTTTVEAPVTTPNDAPSHRRLRLIIVGIFIAITVFAVPRPWTEPAPQTSPRESIGLTLAHRWANGDGFRAPLRYAEQLPADISRALTPRDAAREGGDVVPKDFAGTMLLFGALIAIWPPLAALASPLAGAAVGLLAASVTEAFARGIPPARRRWYGTVAMLLTLSYAPLMVASSSMFMGDAIGAAFVLLAVRLFLQAWEDRSARAVFGLSLAFGAAVAMRYTNALIGVVPFLALLLTKRLSPRTFAVAVAGIIPAAVAILAFNASLYGDPLTTGYALGTQLVKDTVNLAGSQNFRPYALYNHLVLYTFVLPTMLFVPLLGAIGGTARAWRYRRAGLSLGAVLAGTALVAAFHFPQGTHGADSVVVSASLFRYLLAPVAIWLGLAVITIGDASAWVRRHGRVLVAVLVLAGVATAFVGPRGLVRIRRSQTLMAGVHERVLAQTPADALIIVRVADKAIFPERQTLTLTYLLNNPEPVPKGARELFTYVPDAGRFADVVGVILERGIPLYLVGDVDADTLDRYRAAIEARDVTLTAVDDAPTYRLYVLEPA